ncbi:prepilin-type N-terminal cleavage/methylation domain-containing protein [Pontiellaceae bacterium B12219]|nr:prepilin-type N-terminal cleavage/methylation domain-containing protein [Pontiellaceae bacterium B12219]
MKKHGFTLIELLVVIVILSILFTLGSKGLRAARQNAKKAQARVEIHSIETAVLSYFSKYGKLPSDEFSSDLEMDFSEAGSSADLISILTLAEGEDALNPSSIVFLDPQSNDPLEGFRDPWGAEYRIALDTDYDGFLTVENEPDLRGKVAVAAVGYYLLNGASDTNDLITTWQ